MRAAKLKNGEKILDAMCGYGSVSKQLLIASKRRKIKIDIFLLDESGIQIARARKNLPRGGVSKFMTKHLPDYKPKRNTFNTIIVKMVLHENPKHTQVTILKALRNALKRNGKIVIWDIMFTKSNQKIFQEIIKRKDELAGFRELERNRYFFTESEFLGGMRKAGFREIRKFHRFNYRFSSKNRLEPEFGNDRKKLDDLNEFIRKTIPEKQRSRMKYFDKGSDVGFVVIKKIFVAENRL